MKRKQSILPRKKSNSFIEGVMLVLIFFKKLVCQVEEKERTV